MSKGGLCRGLEWVIDLNDTRDGPLALDPRHGKVSVHSFYSKLCI